MTNKLRLTKDQILDKIDRIEKSVGKGLADPKEAEADIAELKQAIKDKNYIGESKMSKFEEYQKSLNEKLDKSDIKRLGRVSGAEASKETLANVTKDPSQVIRRLFGQENVEKDIIDYIASERKAGADLGEDTQLVLFIASLQDLLSKIKGKNKK